jgi:hypothetical protein
MGACQCREGDARLSEREIASEHQNTVRRHVRFGREKWA